MKKILLSSLLYLFFCVVGFGQITVNGPITLDVHTHSIPNFIAWEITNADGGIVYEGGNTKVTSFSTGDLTYPLPNNDYSHVIDLPTDGLYEFRAYTNPAFSFCCAFGEASINIKNEAGDTLFTAREFTGSLATEIEAVGLTDLENAAFIREIGDFPALTDCDPVQYKQTDDFINSGSNVIESAEFILILNGEILAVKNWTGTLSPGETTFFVFDETTIDTSGDLRVRLRKVNDGDNSINYVNSLAQSFDGFHKAKTRNTTLSFTTDDKGHELYWEFAFAQNGNVVASGGNERVGVVGGGTMVARTTDPGAYGNQEMVSEDLRVRAAGGCYVLRLFDDFGDGFFNISGPIQLTDTTGEVTDLPLFFSANTEYYIDFDFATTEIQELKAVSEFRAFPNPTSDLIDLQFDLEREVELEVSLLNQLNQQVEVLSPKQKMIGNVRLQKSLSHLNSGLYFIKITDGERSTFEKIIVLK